MRDQGIIYAGLVLFLGVITLPITYNLAAGNTSRPPEVKLPVNSKQCVAPVEYMRVSHMRLLLNWRESVVRNGVRTYRTLDGRTFDMSLTRTCLEQCHTNKAEFCDRCHNYMAVKGPYCMDCHVDPKLAATAVASAAKPEAQP